MNRFIMPIAALLVTAAFVLAGTQVKTTKEEAPPFSNKWMEQRKDQARTLKAGRCYVTTQARQPVFSFQKSYTYVSNIIYILEVDEGKGALVAQPNPDCKFHVEESYKCEYWFRAMSFEEPFLIDPDTHETECPPEFTRENMIERLKASSEANEFRVGK